MNHCLKFFALGAFIGLTALACSDDDSKPARTREDFCRDWANAACSPGIVSTCQAATPEACHLSQQQACEALVPADFSDKHADACIKAVGDAYSDLDLTGEELITVLQLGGPCSQIVKGPKIRGEACTDDRDCDESEGFRCVLRGDQTGGTCQIPELVSAGQKCTAPQQICDVGFYCDGRNCIATKEDGDECTNDYECGETANCATGNQCMPLLVVGATCVASEECASGLCYTVNGSSKCADRIRLSPAEPLCDKLR
jgi:hypothetical protein